MKFVNTNKLNDLHDDFEKHSNEQDFQTFVEESMDKGKPICLGTEGIREVLERIQDEDYNFLLECDDEDLEFWGQDYLRRINFFRRLLGEKEGLTIEDIKEGRQ